VKLLSEERRLTVSEFMSSPVVTIHSKATFVEAVQNMALNGIGNLVVADGKKVAGVITERELLHHLVLNKSIPNKQVKYFLKEKFIKLDPGTSILSAAKSMIEKKERLLVFHKASTGVPQLVGIITASDIVRGFLETDRNPGLEGAMTNKIFTLKPGNTILAASKMMLRRGIGSVLVTSNGSPYSIFTERDLLNRVLGHDVDIEEKIGPYSTRPVVTAPYGIRASDAAKLMFANKIKRLPLTEDGRIKAMVTARDLVEAFQRGR